MALPKFAPVNPNRSQYSTPSATIAAIMASLGFEYLGEGGKPIELGANTNIITEIVDKKTGRLEDCMKAEFYFHADCKHPIYGQIRAYEVFLVHCAKSLRQAEINGDWVDPHDKARFIDNTEKIRLTNIKFVNAIEEMGDAIENLNLLTLAVQEMSPFMLAQKNLKNGHIGAFLRPLETSEEAHRMLSKMNKETR